MTETTLENIWRDILAANNTGNVNGAYRGSWNLERSGRLYVPPDHRHVLALRMLPNIPRRSTNNNNNNKTYAASSHLDANIKTNMKAMELFSLNHVNKFKPQDQKYLIKISQQIYDSRTLRKWMIDNPKNPVLPHTQNILTENQFRGLVNHLTRP